MWEIALKSQRGDLRVHSDLMTFVRDQKRAPGVRIRPLTSKMVTLSVELPLWIRKFDGREHRDPCDRFLVAQSRLSNATLITCDEVILDYAASGKLVACDARR